MVAISLLGTVLFATSVFAIPSSSERFSARLARRAAGTHLSNPNDRIAVDNLITSTNTSHVQYSSNWAGAVYDTYPAGTFKSVTGTFIVPTPSKPSGAGSGTYYASAWVGIDGDTCGTAILQTGLDFNIGSSASYDAWYEWYPDYAYDFSGITFKAGDSVTITVTATSTKAGSAVIKNNTTGKSVSKSITSTAALCEQNAEWIVEDFSSSGGLVPFANFGTVTFTGASASTSSGAIGPGSASLIDIQQNGKRLTTSSVSGSSVTVKYTG